MYTEIKSNDLFKNYLVEYLLSLINVLFSLNCIDIYRIFFSN